MSTIKGELVRRFAGSGDDRHDREQLAQEGIQLTQHEYVNAESHAYSLALLEFVRGVSYGYNIGQCLDMFAQEYGTHAPLTNSCGSCRYFATANRECRFYPPRSHVLTVSQRIVSVYPQTKVTYWCGSYLFGLRTTD